MDGRSRGRGGAEGAGEASRRPRSLGHTLPLGMSLAPVSGLVHTLLPAPIPGQTRCRYTTAATTGITTTTISPATVSTIVNTTTITAATTTTTTGSALSVPSIHASSATAAALSLHFGDPGKA